MIDRYASLRWWVTLLLFTTAVLCVVSIPTIFTDPFPETMTSIFLFFLFYISQYFFFALCVGAVLFPIFLFFKSNRAKIFFSFFPVAATFIFFAMNAKVFSFWRIHINSSVIHLYFTKGGGSQVFEVNTMMMTWIMAIIAMMILITLFVFWISRHIDQRFPIKSCLITLFAMYFASQSVVIYFVRSNHLSGLFETVKIPYFFELSIANALEKWGVPLAAPSALSTQLKSILKNQAPLHYPLHPLRYHVPLYPKNVLLIVVDSLRYDMINPANMPVAHDFAKQANRFLNNMSGGDCTRSGIFSLFYGIPSTYWNSALQHHQGSIVVRAFQDNHYHFGIFASAPLLAPPFDQTVFKTLSNIKLITPGNTPFDRDRFATQEMQLFLQQQAKHHQRFFGFIFYDAPHAYNAFLLTHPFHPVSFLNYFHVNNETDRTPIFNLYKNAVFEDDYLIGKLLKTIRQLRLSKNTVIIITADHGQEFNDLHNNYWEHASGFSRYQVQTPLLIAWPGRRSQIFTYQTTHFDLAPTLLKHILGVTNATEDYSVGQDFFSTSQPSFLISGNYDYHAVILKNDVVIFQNSGWYRFTDRHMQSQLHPVISPMTQKKILEKMSRFYSS